MKKIGVLFGPENTFPSALVDRINSLDLDNIRAEFVHVGGVPMAAPSGYAVIVDRVSHDLPFYRSYLKNALLTGTHIINNPFWWSADDKFLNYALAARLGVPVPRTVLLPHKQLPQHITPRSLRNLEYPLDWDSIFDYVRFPAFLKPHNGGGWRDVHHVRNREEFFTAYDQTRDLSMVLQAEVPYDQYFRCFVVGQSEVLIMSYDPRRPHEQRYIFDKPLRDKILIRKIRKHALALCRALGYDFNTVEFAVEKGVPYAIDYFNPAPDADLHTIGQANFDWVVDAVARLCIRKAQARTPLPRLRWSALLNGPLPKARKPTESKLPRTPKPAR
ncbi:glutathione synthase [Edaphobacter acidisoli]|uniref:Glutathione synthase n=1 Tax=Edaphobacter acidisoli TaxID=2040573 RepID=A0A916VZ90_9BACT|nr:hypothetical protein [Edaphobacter acidisoli]GGA54051.1 glutathione synthase [Edaphobacter acidisoli]